MKPIRIFKSSIFYRRLAPGALALPLPLLWLIRIAGATEPARQITWGNPLKQEQIYNDPFLELTPEQILDLVVIAMIIVAGVLIGCALVRPEPAL